MEWVAARVDTLGGRGSQSTTVLQGPQRSTWFRQTGVPLGVKGLVSLSQPPTSRAPLVSFETTDDLLGLRTVAIVRSTSQWAAIETSLPSSLTR